MSLSVVIRDCEVDFTEREVWLGRRGGRRRPALSDARDPIAGSPNYLQASPAAAQTANLALSGHGSFSGDLSAGSLTTSGALIAGSASLASGLNAASGGFTGTVTAAKFSGDGSLLKSLSAAELNGQVADGLLSTNICRASVNNSFSGTQQFVNLSASGTIQGSFSGDGSALTGVNLQPAKDYADQKLAAGGAVAGSVATAQSDPASCQAGAMYFNTSDNTLRVCNGTSFVPVAAGGGVAGQNPSDSNRAHVGGYVGGGGGGGWFGGGGGAGNCVGGGPTAGGGGAGAVPQDRANPDRCE